MAEFNILLKDVNGHSIGEITPSEPEWQFYHNRIGYCNFDLSRSHQLAKQRYIHPYSTDFVLYRDNKPLMGGIVTDTQIDNAEGSNLKVACQEYLHYYERRYFPFDPADVLKYKFVRTKTDLFTIVEDMFSYVSSQSYSLPMTFNNGKMGTLASYTIEPGDTEDIFSKLSSLSETEPGFDFWGTWDMKLMLAQERGRLTSYGFEVGVNCKTLEYEDKGIVANSVVGFGAGTTTKVAAKKENTDLMKQYRRLENYVDIGQQIANKQLAESKTQAQLDKDSRHLHIPGVEVYQRENDSVWDSISPGDTAPVRGDLDYVYVDDKFQVVAMRGNVNKNGDETVQIQFNEE